MTDQHPQGRNSSAVALIAERYASLSPSHMRIADFILASPHEAALMTLERLSAATGVSTATANRFGCQLGLSGYPELKRLLHQELREALRPVEDFVDTIRVGGLSPQAPWTQSFEEDLRRIRGIRAVGGEGAFARACKLIAESRRLWVAGFGSSAFLAQYAAFNLSTLRDDCHALSDAGGLEGLQRQLIGTGGSDAAIQLAFARYSQAGVAVAEQFRRNGVPIILITDGEDFPAAAFAAAVFVVERKAGFLLTGGGAGAIAVIEALLHGSAAAIGREEVERRAARLTQLLGASVLVPKPS